VMAIINLDYFNVWILACEQQVALLQCVMPMAMKNLTIAQHWHHFVMPLFVKMVIGFKSIDSNQRIMCIYNINYFVCDCKMCHSSCVKGFTFLDVIVGRPKWSNISNNYVIVCHVIFPMWMVKLTCF
jgi:hypothetical protein